MLRRLTNDQTTRYWSDIKAHLLYTLPPQMEISDEALNNILESILRGNSQVWVVMGEGDMAKEIYAMVITTFSIEETTKTKNLLIYSLSGYRFVPEDLWKDAIIKMKAYARGNSCHKIIAYTQIKRILTIAGDLGADTSVSLVSWEV